MEVNHKEFLENQIAMTKVIMKDLLILGEDEPVFAIKLDIDDIGKKLIVNYWYAKNPDVDYVFPDEEEQEIIKEHRDWMKKLDALTKLDPESVVSMTLLELLDAVREQLESYKIRIVD